MQFKKRAGANSKWGKGSLLSLLSLLLGTGKAHAALTLTATPPSPVKYGADLQFHISGGVASEAYTFNDGGFIGGGGILNASGGADFAKSTLNDDPGPISFSVNGGTSGTSNTLSYQIDSADSTTTLVSDINPSTSGQSITLTATITVDTPAPAGDTSNVTSTLQSNPGTVQFKDGAGNLGSPQAITNTGGVYTATLTTNALNEGSHSLTAVYSGETTYSFSFFQDVTRVNGSTSNTVTQDVNPPQPSVTSITRVDPSPTISPSVQYTVQFDRSMTGVDTNDFSLTTTGISGASVTNVSGSGSTYTVTVGTGSGEGTLRLDIMDDDSIVDGSSQPLGGPGAQNYTSGEVYQIVAPVQAGQVLISEFRARGPQGESDEFIELYNNTDNDLTVVATDGSAGWAVAGSDGTIRATLANGFVFLARSHYLIANGLGYSLGNTTPEDVDYSTNLPTTGLGIALFSTSNAGNFSLTNRLDAVGYSDEASGLYREGNGLPPGNAEMTQDLEYSFVRNLASGQPADTDNNLVDFLPVETSLSGTTALGEKLGSPGPEGQISPITHNETSVISVELVNPGVAASSSPNRDRNVGDTDLGHEGSLSINRIITNHSGQPLSWIRLRVASLTTAPQVSGRADLRVKGVKIQRGSGQLLPWSAVSLKPVDEPSNPSLGGGLNSRLTLIDDADPIGPLEDGESLTISIVLGVESFGSFKFAANVEVLP
jgi:hypothetical protein